MKPATDPVQQSLFSREQAPGGNEPKLIPKLARDGAAKNGLRFEKSTDFLDMVKSIDGMSLARIKKTRGGEIVRADILYKGNKVAEFIAKHQIYKFFEERCKQLKFDFTWDQLISKKTLPDSALLIGNSLRIFEKKYQEVAGSVDEKLQTGPFKLWLFRKLFKPLEISVEYSYILSNWFDKNEYRDVFEYLANNGVDVHIDSLPFEKIFGREIAIQIENDQQESK